MNLIKKELVLAEKGQTNLSIILEKNSTPIEKFAARELKRYFKAITGLDLKPGSRSSRDRSVSIFLKRAGNWKPVSEDKFSSDYYSITVDREMIILESDSDRGLLYSVYDLLEKLGCMWIFPGENEEFVPRKDRLSLEYGKSDYSPLLALRGQGLYELNLQTVKTASDIIDWMAKNRMNLFMTSWDRPDETNTQAMHWAEVEKELTPKLQKRGFILEISEHMTHIFFPPSLYDENPQWFGLCNGKRGKDHQICFSNKEAVEHFANQVSLFATDHPEADIIGTWPLDGAGGYCECEGCRDDTAAFRAFTVISETVKKTSPRTLVEFLAYKPSTFTVPPSELKIPHNSLSLICDRRDQLAYDWCNRMEEAQGCLYFEYELGDDYHWTANIWLRPHYGQWLAEKLNDIGYRGYLSLFISIRNWWRASFNNYFFSKALWGQDIKEELTRFCDNYFREYSREMASVFDILFNKMQNPALMKIYRWADGYPGYTPGPSELEPMKRFGEKAIAQIDALIRTTTDKTVRLNLERFRDYTSYFCSYYEERSKYRNENPEKLLKTLSGFSPQTAVTASNPDFIQWRFEKIIQWEIDCDAGF